MESQISPIGLRYIYTTCRVELIFDPKMAFEIYMPVNPI